MHDDDACLTDPGKGEQTWAIVGATGLVGREALSILESRRVPASRVRILASEQSAGGHLVYAGERLVIESIENASFTGVDVALFCATGEVARKHAPRGVEAGARVIDNSAAFRLDERVPLVVPEINGHLLDGDPPVIANPNCSTIILLATLEPLRKRFGIESIQVATYQAISGAGQTALDELITQTRAVGAGNLATPRHFTEPCAGNVFSHDSPVEPETGVNGEERKIITESRKIWDDPNLRITPTCIRVPVERAHTQAITVVLVTPVTEQGIREAFASTPGLCVVDDREANCFPAPLKATGRDEILLGRIRPDPGVAVPGMKRSTRWCLMASADQLRKGAALNSIQIADNLI